MRTATCGRCKQNTLVITEQAYGVLYECMNLECKYHFYYDIGD